MIRELRTALSPLPDGITDKEILKTTEGTLLRLSCEFRDFIRQVLYAFGLKPNF